MEHDRTRVAGRARLVSLLFATAYGAALVAGAFTVPLYGSQTVDSTGAVTSGSASLADVNGPYGAVVAAVPLLVTVLVAVVLVSQPARRAQPIGWTLTGILTAFNVLALTSVGIFLLPVTVALVIACASRPDRSVSPPNVL